LTPSIRSLPSSALVVVAHPDDCEFSCGGTVRKWADAGTAVTLITVAGGSLGSHDPELAGSDLVATREREQRESAQVLGIREVRFLRHADGRAQADESLIDALAVAIRELRPAVVLTHDPWKLYMLHPDHVEIGRAVVRAALRAREPLESIGNGLAAWRPAELWLFSAEQPNHVEGTSSAIDGQISALLCHRSQYQTSMGFDAADPAGRSEFVERFKRAAAEIGAGAGFDHGEAFRRIRL
jgi:LmbE family N-acetylglucosaminyl deacetylase